MDIDYLSLNCIILYVAFFFCGVVDAISGGGGLITMPVFLSTGFPVHYISGTSMCAGAPGAITAMLKFIKSGYIHWKTSLITGPFAIIGALAGAKLNIILPTEYLEKVMIFLIPIVAIFVLFNKKLGIENEVNKVGKVKLFIYCVLIGLVLGGYQGFYAAGVGTFYILAFAFLCRLDLIRASGDAKFVIVLANITACITYVLGNVVIWPVAIIAAIASTIGNYIGASLAIKKGSRLIRPMFIIIIVGLFIKLLFDLMTR